MMSDKPEWQEIDEGLWILAAGNKKAVAIVNEGFVTGFLWDGDLWQKLSAQFVTIADAKTSIEQILF